MPREAPPNRTSTVTKIAVTAAGSSHRRHGAVLAWPRGSGWDMRIDVLLLGTRPYAGRGVVGSGGGRGRAGTWPAGRPWPGRSARPGQVSRGGCIRERAARWAREAGAVGAAVALLSTT